MNILVVEDEKKISELVEAYLLKDGYGVFKAYDGLEAMSIYDKEMIHLIVLDLMIPKLSGEDVCRKIRAVSDVPIIMLTAKVQLEDKINGISIGADDYLTKPFSARELLVRIKALLRRSYKEPLAEGLSFNDGDLKIDLNKLEVKKKENIIILTSVEFKILKTLLINPGQVFSREQLMDKVFEDNSESFDRTIDTHIKNIRKKIEDNPKSPIYIITIYGAGYKFGGKS
ncbi:MAG: response regulator transcription factor [Clostridiaceae bacterium]